jgi:hypothetical protein
MIGHTTLLNLVRIRLRHEGLPYCRACVLGCLDRSLHRIALPISAVRPLLV